MNNKPIDRSKKSNIKCEHCRHWNYETGFRGKGCINPDSPKYNQPTNYWNRCKCFEWLYTFQQKQER